VTNPFDTLNKAVKRNIEPRKGGFRHEREDEIISHALGNMSLSAKGQELITFKDTHDIQIGVLKSKSPVDYVPEEKTAYISATSSQNSDDPILTIHLAGALREAMQEHIDTLKKPTIAMSEAEFSNRFVDKATDKLVWQTIIVYELGKIANMPEFVDSFVSMGYSNLIESYGKKLTESS